MTSAFLLFLLFMGLTVNVSATVRGSRDLLVPKDDTEVPAEHRFLKKTKKCKATKAKAKKGTEKKKNKGKDTSKSKDVADECEEEGPTVVDFPVLAFSEPLSSTAFNCPTEPLCIDLTNGEFAQDPSTVSFIVNGAASGLSSFTSTQICSSDTLKVGRNDVSLDALDSSGSALRFSGTIWAGSESMTANIFEAATGNPYLKDVAVTAQLSDDATVTAELATSTGETVFTCLPPRTIVFTAIAPIDNFAGSDGAVAGIASTVDIVIEGFMEPSETANKDFSAGLEGWTNEDSTVSLISHLESVGPSPITLRRELQGFDDNDLLLSTNSVEGPTKTSHAFNTQAGTKAVSVRYRFVTSEVPGGYFGTQFNDYYDVSIRSKNGGSYLTEANTMNGLGLAAFDFASGSTAWRYVSLNVDENGDTVQVDATVANVADGLFQSQVVIDFVEEVTDYVCVYTNTAAYFSDNNLGHAAILLAETDPDTSDLTITTWGLWPDDHPDTPDNGSGTDIRKNFVNDNFNDFTYFYCEPVTEKQKSLLKKLGDEDITWTCTNNCSSFASETFRKVTGVDIDADDEFFLGAETPVEMGKSIINKNKGSNIPAGGLPFLSNRRELVPASAGAVGSVLVSSFIGQCFVFT